MIELTGIMTSISSLHVGTGKKSGTFSKTLEYVPGRTIRGMVGYHLYTNNKDLFDKLRISEDCDMSKTGVFIKDALPLHEDKITVASPASLRWCKKCDSLMGYKKTECSNVADDKKCPHKGKKCLHEGKKIAGFITKDSISTGKLEKANVVTHIETKCPITRGDHASPGKDFDLSPYHIESIDAGTKFQFRCIVEDKFEDSLKEALCEAGVFAGVGGYRSRGYGTVSFSDFKVKNLDDVIDRRTDAISKISNPMMVVNSPLILQDGDDSVIGFGSEFIDYTKRTFGLCGLDASFRFRDGKDKNPIKQRISEGIARGWSIKNDNKVSEIIPCIGAGSCVEVVADNPKALATLEAYGVGEMTNSGYGDVYFIGGQI